MKHIRITICLTALLSIAIHFPATGAQRSKQIELTAIGRYSAGSEGAEIAAYDPATKRIFSINAGLSRVDVLDLSDPSDPVLLFRKV